MCEDCKPSRVELLGRPQAILVQYTILVGYDGNTKEVEVLATNTAVVDGCLLLFHEDVLICGFAAGAWLTLEGKPCLP